MKELNMQEQAFAALYLESFNATQAALGAGYSEHVAKNHAWSWVSITGCPVNKRHLRDDIQSRIDTVYGEENIDKGWLLRRAKLLAEFSLGKFLTVNDNGDACYDFSLASDDDWWCIEEYTTEQVFRKAASSGGALVPVDKIKIKTPSKVAALKLLGDHIDVGAFKQQVEVSGTIQMNIAGDEADL